MMSTQFKNNITELTELWNSGQLNRKKHWRLYHKSLRFARLNPVEISDMEILSKVDASFFDKWRVAKIRSTIGISLLLLAVLIVQISFFIIMIQEISFIFGLVIFLAFSLTNFTLSHVIFHWMFGIALGIRFKSVFIFKSSFRKARFPFNLIGNIMPAFGIKYDVFSFLKVEKWKRTAMFISAPILTWFWFLVNYLFLIALYPSELSALTLIGIILAIIFFINQILSYYGKGDFWKASRDYR
jgi:hypothetical protein